MYVEFKNSKFRNAAFVVFLGLSIVGTSLLATAEIVDDAKEPTAVVTEETSTDSELSVVEAAVKQEVKDSQEASEEASEEASVETKKLNLKLLNDAGDTFTCKTIYKVLGLELGDIEASKKATVQDTVDALMKYSDVEKNLSTYKAEYNNGLAINLGLINYNTDTTKVCATDDFKAMIKPIEQFKAALAAEKRTPLFLNGMAQPIFPLLTVL